MQVQKKIVVDVTYNTSIGRLKDALAKVPNTASMRIIHTPRDRPWEPEINQLEITWTEEM